MSRGEQFHRLELPALLAELLQRLPDSIRTAHRIRVTAEKDTHFATRIVQRWRVSKNPIFNVRSDDKEDFDFLIAAPFAEKVSHKVAHLIREGKKFAVLIAVDLLPQIKVTKTKENDEFVQQYLLSMPTMLGKRFRHACQSMQRRGNDAVIATILAHSHRVLWLVSHPDYRLPKQGHVVLYGTRDRVSTEEPKENGSVISDVIMTEESDDSKDNLFTSSNSDWANKSPSSDSIGDWSRAVVDGIDRLCCDGDVRDPEGSRTLVAATRSRVRAFAEAPVKAGVSTEAEEHDANSVLSQAPKRAND
jgi:hypothetical protein